MKRYFAETNGYNCVLFVDDKGKAVVIQEEVFDEPLTLEVAKAADYSNFDNCETAEEANANYGNGENLINFNEDEYENIVEF